jgi:hypothetical protein
MGGVGRYTIGTASSADRKRPAMPEGCLEIRSSPLESSPLDIDNIDF